MPPLETQHVAPEHAVDPHAQTASFEHLVERYAPLVLARCQRALPGADAQDATQAVFWILAQRSEQAAASPAPAAWLMRVTEHVVRNALRDRRRRVRAERAAGAASPMSTPAGDDLDLSDLKVHLDQALAELPAPERQAIALHYLAGHSVAETATLAQAGLSTIKDRLQRGIERLRAQLRRRGYQASDAALLAALPRLTRPVPPALLEHLKRLHSASSPPLPPHIRRWSRQGPSMATLIGTALGASLLCVVAAFEVLPGADAAHEIPAPAVDAVQPPPTPSPENLSDLYATLDLQRASSCVVLRWHDGVRTAARLDHLPELALLPDRGAALKTKLSSLRSATVEINIESMMPRAFVVSQYQLTRDNAALAPAERMQRVLAQSAQLIKDQKAHPLVISIPALTGSAQLSAADAPILASITRLLIPAGDGHWQVAHADSRFLVSRQGRELGFSSVCPNSPAPVFPPLTSVPAAQPGSDLELLQSFDPGTGHLTRLWDMAISITSDGLHLSASSLPQERFQAAPAGLPVVDRSAFDRLPADTMLAGAWALHAASSPTSPWITSLLANLQGMAQHAAGDAAAPDAASAANAAHVKRLVDSAQDALLHVDGQVLLWIEPGTLLPVVTMTADMPRAQGQALINAFGTPVAEDGTLQLQLGMLSLTLGWANGQLICTSSPQGLAAASGGAHGFTRQPAITRALAALPGTDPQVLFLLQPEILAKTMGALAPLVEPDSAGPLADYQHRLAAQSAYGYLTMSSGVAGTQVEASGLLALFGVACLAEVLQMPHAAN